MEAGWRSRRRSLFGLEEIEVCWQSSLTRFIAVYGESRRRQCEKPTEQIQIPERNTKLSFSMGFRLSSSISPPFSSPSTGESSHGSRPIPTDSLSLSHSTPGNLLRNKYCSTAGVPRPSLPLPRLPFIPGCSSGPRSTRSETCEPFSF